MSLVEAWLDGFKRQMLRLVGKALIAVLVFAALAAIGGGAYRAYRQSSAADALVISTPNGIDEGLYVAAGGIEQWVSIRGADRNNPILLFVHGGPAEIMSFVPAVTQSLESEFTVVHWDQRGAGRTYRRNPKPPAGLTLARMTADGVEIVEWLKRYLGQRNVVLVGHSWGTMLGENIVFARPDLFAAYVGTGQFVSWAPQVEAEYEYSLSRAQAEGDTEKLSALRELGDPPFDELETYLAFRAVMRDQLAQADLEFAARQASALAFSPRVSLLDIWNALQGARASVAELAPVLMSADLTALGNDFPIPFVLVQGAADHITPAALALDYAGRINAPAKAVVQIEDAGHYAFITHAEAFHAALVSEVLPLLR
jgi:pimeloyl-ACP methyl ester carboxylesterase